MPLSETEWTSLADCLQGAVSRVAPEWSDLQIADPGVALLEVFAFLLTDLKFRPGPVDARARVLARLVARRAEALAAPSSSENDCDVGLQRVNFMHGMLLGVEDFRTEQEYARSRLNRRNRALHGAGIVDGLQVTVDGDASGSGSAVTIAPGLAFDPAGNEIWLDRPLVHALPAHGDALLVLVAYAEQLCGSAPAGASRMPVGANTSTQPTRITETFRVALSPVPAADAVPIARLRQVRGRWRVDATFEAMRIRMSAAN